MSTSSTLEIYLLGPFRVAVDGLVLYALTGNKQQALKQYELCSQTLLKELDAEPELATRELQRQILTGQIAPPPAKTDLPLYTFRNRTTGEIRYLSDAGHYAPWPLAHLTFTTAPPRPSKT